MRSYAADMILLDGTLRDYGDGALAARRALRDYAISLLHTVWPDRPSNPYIVPTERGLELITRVREEIRRLKPANDDQRRLMDEALTSSAQLLRQRWLLIEQSGASVRPAGHRDPGVMDHRDFYQLRHERADKSDRLRGVPDLRLRHGKRHLPDPRTRSPLRRRAAISSRPVANAVANILPEGR